MSFLCWKLDWWMGTFGCWITVSVQSRTWVYYWIEGELWITILWFEALSIVSCIGIWEEECDLEWQQCFLLAILILQTSFIFLTVFLFKAHVGVTISSLLVAICGFKLIATSAIVNLLLVFMVFTSRCMYSWVFIFSSKGNLTIWGWLHESYSSIRWMSAILGVIMKARVILQSFRSFI